MTVSPVLSVWRRRLTRGLLALVALTALGFSIAAGLMYFWVLPNVADHRDTVASLMTRALGQRVTLEAVAGEWHQARPEFHLAGVRLYDQHDRPALFLPEFKATFSWRSLLVLEPRFNQIDLRGLVLNVRRAQDGHYYVGGIPVNPAAPDSGFVSWLLRQGGVQVRDAALTWQDDVRQAPAVDFDAVSLTLTNAGRTHRLKLAATPPATLARPLGIEANWTARRADDIKTWSGVVDTKTAGVSFARLLTWLDVPYQPTRGWGALQVRLGLERGVLTQVNAGFSLSGIETRLQQGLPPLHLAQALGQMRWQKTAGGHQLDFDNLRVAPPGYALGAPFSLGLAWQEQKYAVTARTLPLAGWDTILPSLPMDPALRDRVQRLHLKGRLDTLRLAWTGARPGPENFEIDARFTGVGAAAVDAQPGVDNLSGHVAGNTHAGTFSIDSHPMRIDLSTLFRDPVLKLEELNARGSWKKTARGHLLVLDNATFSNADAAGAASGKYERVGGTPGLVDLRMQLSRADGTAVYRYLPKKIGDRTVNWLKDAIKAGHSNDVRLTLRGDISAFPFEQGNGVFEITADVKDVALNYVQGWPRIEGIDARVAFRGKMMEITSRQARMYGVALGPVRAVIPDLLHHEEQLHIEGEANGPLQDFIRFANFSPVGERLRGFTDTLTGSGPTRLGLKLHIPLRHSHDATVVGRLTFLDDTLFPSGLPRINQVKGDIDFTQDGLTARNITAQFLGGPLNVDTLTQNGLVRILARGRATAAGMAPWLGAPWNKRLSGQAAWRGQVDLLATGARVRIESDLLGLASSLPAPLSKAAEQPMSLAVTSQPHEGGQQHEILLGSTVGAVWQQGADDRFARGELRFGGPAVLPRESGLRLAGSGEGLDFSGWLALLPSGEAEDALPLMSMDLGFDSIDLMGRRYRDIKLVGRTRNGLFRTVVTGDAVNGVLTYRPGGGAQPARVSAQFKQLTIPARAPNGGATAALNLKGADFPILDLTVDDFRLQSRMMGRLEAVARGAPQGLVIDKLRLAHPDSVFRMSGLWRDSGIGETHAELNLSVADAGKFMARFGYPDTIKRGTAEVQGTAVWAGSPADFAFPTLAGQLDFKAREGQFLKVDPGVGKLLGVLSLQALPRRLNLDFRDIFNEGFAFDEMGATLRMTRGVVYSDDFRMRGPSAKVNMSGLVDINQESVQLRLKVIPKLSESVAVAGALIGGPLAGLGAYAAQKILRDPVEEAISQEYLVTGPWLSPEVARLTKTRGKPDSQVNEP
ncbi:MAG: TIGR02099 family protein [Thiobacillus sp.]|nr:TIGR02099 family protein [Thiobacillus sp.]